MGTIGAVFQPELIKLMRAVLDNAVETLPEAKRTSTVTAEIASQILACAAKGERDPAKLKKCCAVGPGRVFALFARHLAGTARGMSVREILPWKT